MSKKIRKGDKVIVMAGNFSGQTGTVLRKNGEKVVVQGVNMRKKHVKRSQQNPQGNILTLERPVHISNLKLCVGDDKPVKLKVKTDKKGERELVYHEGKKEVTYRSIKKPAANAGS